MKADPKLNTDFSTFDPRAYLDEYYDHVGSENDGLLAFLAEAYKTIGRIDGQLLEIGGGPTIYQLISSVNSVKSITFTDFLESNLGEVQSWVMHGSNAFNWNQFIRVALEHEKNHTPTEDEILERVNEVKNTITVIKQADINSSTSFEEYKRKFDIVSVHFVPESVATSKEQWAEYMNLILSLVKPNGYLVMSGLLGAKYWQNGEEQFGATNIQFTDVEELFRSNDIEIQDHMIIDSEHGDVGQGYAGMFSLLAKRSQ